ncbi:MAG TPA: VOC family protein, partial [Tepidisphaeraceae bacterium]|nr:VOC family protein [Tepidisphaeraceae bacterium]
MLTFIVPVKDIARAKRVYGALLGAEPYYEQPYYVGFKIGDQELGLDPNGHSAGQIGPIGYWHVDDIKDSLRGLIEAGAQVHQDVRDIGGGKQIATVKDTDGNV